jgi:hypothetical protein
MTGVTPETFRAQIKALTDELSIHLAGQLPGPELADWLNTRHGPASATYQELKTACEIGVRDGWLCNREGGGIRYGRIFKPAEDLNGYSVDVVDMESIAGPHHVHPQGEIDLVMPQSGNAKFDGQGAGWKVYGPGSGHQPTVSDGRALVLYLLPNGEIQFTK